MISKTRWYVLSLTLLGVALLAAWADWRTGWITPAFDFVAHQFYEIPNAGTASPSVSAPSGSMPSRDRLVLLVLGLTLFPRLGRHGRIWLLVFWIGYAILATVWISGGNLPLVSG